MFQYYLKLSWLSIRRTPALTALMVIAIGLGISVSMTVLTIHYLMGKDPIPSKSDRLYHVQLDTFGKGFQNNYTEDGFPLQLTYQDAVNIHLSPVPFRKTRSLLTGFTVIPESPDIFPFGESARAIDRDFFRMFNLTFLYGNAWRASVDQQAAKVVVIGKKLNDKLFNGQNSVGKQIQFSSDHYTVVGVIDDWQPVPRYYDLNSAHFNDAEQIFVPFSLVPIEVLRSWGNNNSWKTENVSGFQEKLQSEIMWIQYWVELENDTQKALYQDWLLGYVEHQKKVGRFEHEGNLVALKNVVQWMIYNEVVSEDSTILVGLSFMFLVVCMINTVGLLLSKFLERAPEIGVRRALGASQKDIFLQHLIDVSIIGLLGGVLGLCLGQLGLLGIKNLYSNYEQLVYMDFTLVLFAIALSLGSSVLAGLFPAWMICRTNPSLYLKLQ